jgi:hypothetical protein
VFRNNRNKQKTNRNSRKFVKISSFLIPHTISSVCFGCFDFGLKHRNKPKKKFGLLKKQTERDEFRFVLVQTEKKKITVLPLIKNVFWTFFRFVSVCFDKVLFVSVVSIQVRNAKSTRN